MYCAIALWVNYWAEHFCSECTSQNSLRHGNHIAFGRNICVHSMHLLRNLRFRASGYINYFATNELWTCVCVVCMPDACPIASAHIFLPPPTAIIIHIQRYVLLPIIPTNSQYLPLQQILICVIAGQSAELSISALSAQSQNLLVHLACDLGLSRYKPFLFRYCITLSLWNVV